MCWCCKERKLQHLHREEERKLQHLQREEVATQLVATGDLPVCKERKLQQEAILQTGKSPVPLEHWSTKTFFCIDFLTFFPKN
jgi:hypothetical protein